MKILGESLTSVTADTVGNVIQVPSWRRVWVACGEDASDDFGNGDLKIEISPNGGTDWYIYASVEASGTTLGQTFELPPTGSTEYWVRAVLVNSTSPNLTVAVFVTIQTRN